MAAHQAPPFLGFSRQEHLSGLPFPSPMHERESEVFQSRPTLSDPMDCSLPGSSVHGIFQARVPQWVAIAFFLIGYTPIQNKGFLDGWVFKESTCNVGDPGSIPWSGRSPGERISYPLQYSWASLLAQLVKNPPEMWETKVQSLGWEDSLEKGKATTPVFWPGEFYELYIVHGVAKSQTWLTNFHYKIKSLKK